MIWSIVLLVGWTFIGRAIARLIYTQAPLVIELVSGFLLGNLIMVYFLFGVGWWLPYSILTPVLFGFGLVGAVVFFPRKIDFEKEWFAILASFSILFTTLYSLVWQESVMGISLRIRGVWGDWGHHIGLPLYFQALDHSSWNSPFTAGINFTYSFLHALVPTAMMQLGSSLHFSLIATGIVWSVCICILIIYLCRSLGLGRSAVLAPFLFFVTGHLGFIDFFKDLSHRTSSLGEFLTHLPAEYGHIWEKGFHLGSFFDFFLISQRGYVFGLGFGLLVILFLVFSKTRISKIASGVVLGLLPLVHMHTFIAISIAVGVWTICNWRHWKSLLWFWIPVGVGATPYFGWLFHANSALASGSFVMWKLGWLVESENWVWFWFKNAPILLSGLIGIKFMPSKYRWLPLSGWLMFGLVNVVQLQPNLADNNKLLVWWYLLSGILPSLFVIQKLNNYFVTIIFVVITTLSGLLQLAWITQNTWDFASRQDLALAQFASSSCAERRWLTSDRHNHPVFTFAGRPVVMGYRGWLWTWGVNYSHLEDDVRTMFVSPTTSEELFNKYNISYAVLGPSEIYDYRPDLDLWRATFPVVYDTPEYLVFAIHPCSITK